MTGDSRLFRSFWMAGFESACHINSRGDRLDLIAATQHDQLIDEDYGAPGGLGIGPCARGCAGT